MLTLDKQKAHNHRDVQKKTWGRCTAGAGQGLLCVSVADVDGAVQVDAIQVVATGS